MMFIKLFLQTNSCSRKIYFGTYSSRLLIMSAATIAFSRCDIGSGRRGKFMQHIIGLGDWLVTGNSTEKNGVERCI